MGQTFYSQINNKDELNNFVIDQIFPDSLPMTLNKSRSQDHIIVLLPNMQIFILTKLLWVQRIKETNKKIMKMLFEQNLLASPTPEQWS